MQMGRQLNFFLMPEDLAVLESAVRSAGQVKFLRSRHSTKNLEVLDSLVITRDQMGHVDLRAYLCRPDDLQQVTLRYVPNQEHFVVQPGSPVIEVDRCFFDGKFLHRGRLYFFTTNYTPADFTRWASRVFRSVRNSLVRQEAFGGYYYFGQIARRWVEESDAHLVSGGLAMMASIPTSRASPN